MNNESVMNLLEVQRHFSTYIVENCACAIEVIARNIFGLKSKQKN